MKSNKILAALLIISMIAIMTACSQNNNNETQTTTTATSSNTNASVDVTKEEPAATEAITEQQETKTEAVTNEVQVSRLPVDKDIDVAVRFNRRDVMSDGTQVVVYDVPFPDGAVEEIYVRGFNDKDDEELRSIVYMHGSIHSNDNGLFWNFGYISSIRNPNLEYKLWSLDQPEIVINSADVYDCYFGEDGNYTYYDADYNELTMKVTKLSRYILLKAPDDKYVGIRLRYHNGRWIGDLKLVSNGDEDDYYEFEYMHLSELSLGEPTTVTCLGVANSEYDYYNFLKTEELAANLTNIDKEITIENYYGVPKPFGLVSFLTELDASNYYSFSEGMGSDLPEHEYTLDSEYKGRDLKWDGNADIICRYIDAEGTTWYLSLDNDFTPLGWSSKPSIREVDRFEYYNRFY